MKTKKLRKKIDKAVRVEEKKNYLRNAGKSWCEKASLGITDPSNSMIDWVVGVSRQYIESIPNYLDEAIPKANSSGMKKQMTFLFNEIEKYWVLDNDVFPDHLGLLGLMDDAYTSAYLLQRVSEICSSQGKVSLITELDELTERNFTVRRFLGTNVADLLELQVNASIAHSNTKSWMKSILTSTVTNPFSTQNAIWGNSIPTEVQNLFSSVGLQEIIPQLEAMSKRFNALSPEEKQQVINMNSQIQRSMSQADKLTLSRYQSRVESIHSVAASAGIDLNRTF